MKDVEVAKRMIKFIELNTIGVSKDSQLRAAKVLEVVSNSCEQAGGLEYAESFFHFSHALMTKRWRLLREAVKRSGIFSLPNFSPAHCNFFDNYLGTQPGKNNKNLLIHLFPTYAYYAILDNLTVYFASFLQLSHG